MSCITRKPAMPSRGFSTNRSRARMSLMCAASRNLRPPKLDERNIPPRQLDFEWSTVMRGAEEDRLLFKRRSALAVLEHAIRDVASLIGFVAHAGELRSRSRVSIGPEVLGEALSPQTDHAVCRREDRFGRAIVALKRDDFCRRAELGGEVEDVPDGRGAKRIN